MNNLGGTINTKYKVVSVSVHDRMEAYDNLPPNMRKLFREAPFLLTVSEKFKNRKVSDDDIVRFEKRLKEIQKESTRLTYGITHPEAS